MADELTPMKLGGIVLEITDGWAFLEISKEDWHARENLPVFAYAFQETKKKKETVGVEKYVSRTTTMGYLIDGKQKVILRAVLAQTDVPYVEPKKTNL